MTGDSRMRNAEVGKTRPEALTPLTTRSTSSFSGGRQSSVSSGEQQQQQSSARLRTLSGSPTKTDHHHHHDVNDRRLSAPELPPIMGAPKSPAPAPVAELPPIMGAPRSPAPGYTVSNGGTPVSTPRSSDGSSPAPLLNGNSGGGGSISYPVIKRKHKPERISLNSPVDAQLGKSPLVVDTNTSPGSPRNGARRPQLSPGSLSSGYDSPRSTVPPTPKSTGHRQLPLSTEMRLARTKSWCPGNENGGLASPKLETLFEKHLLPGQSHPGSSKSNNNSNNNNSSSAGNKNSENSPVKLRAPRSSAKPPIPGGMRRIQTHADLKGMPRTQSDPVISDMAKNRKLKISHSAKKSSESGKKNLKLKNNEKGNNPQSNSSKSSSLSQERLYMKDVLSRRSSSKADDSAHGDSAGEDGEQDERIIQWLLGVESAEHPPEPEITDDEPSQTDTAIHIVYQGD